MKTTHGHSIKVYTIKGLSPESAENIEFTEQPIEATKQSKSEGKKKEKVEKPLPIKRYLGLSKHVLSYVATQS